MASGFAFAAPGGAAKPAAAGFAFGAPAAAGGAAPAAAGAFGGFAAPKAAAAPAAGAFGAAAAAPAAAPLNFGAAPAAAPGLFAGAAKPAATTGLFGPGLAAAPGAATAGGALVVSNRLGTNGIGEVKFDWTLKRLKDESTKKTAGCTCGGASGGDCATCIYRKVLGVQHLLDTMEEKRKRMDVKLAEADEGGIPMLVRKAAHFHGENKLKRASLHSKLQEQQAAYEGLQGRIAGCGEHVSLARTLLSRATAGTDAAYDVRPEQPGEFIMELARNFEQRIDTLTGTIVALQQHLGTLHQQQEAGAAAFDPRQLESAIQRQHAYFQQLAATVATMHERVEQKKAEYIRGGGDAFVFEQHEQRWQHERGHFEENARREVEEDKATAKEKKKQQQQQQLQAQAGTAVGFALGGALGAASAASAAAPAFGAAFGAKPAFGAASAAAPALGAAFGAAKPAGIFGAPAAAPAFGAPAAATTFGAPAPAAGGFAAARPFGT